MSGKKCLRGEMAWGLVAAKMGAEVAFFKFSDGRVLCGRGPFREAAVAPESGVAFYWNDFGLESGGPWWVPEGGVEEFSGLAEMAEALGEADAVPAVEWDSMGKEGFRSAYDSVRERLEGHGLRKAVPVAVLEGKRKGGRMRGLVGRLGEESEQLRGFGCFGGGSGFLGATPEVLFRMEGKRLETMALAGTAGRGEGDWLVSDEKQRNEHEIVVEHVVDRLAAVGAVSVEPVEPLDVGAMTHLITRVAVQMVGTWAAEDLVRLLHPTPAVGVAPRSLANLRFLRGLREEAGVPGVFGAPFGVSVDGFCEVLVAIRAVFWEGDAVKIAAGCGVVGASDFEKEWEEVGLKCGAVRELFGL